MTKSSMKSRATWSVLGAVALVACSSDPGGMPSGEASPSESHSELARVKFPTSASPEAAFAFFGAITDGAGYRVAAVNGAPFACGNVASATSCRVSSIDLSILNLDPQVAAKIMRGVGHDPTSPTLLFAGTVVDGALSVQEIWKAPSAVPLTGTIFHVSHQPQEALVVNAWTTASIGTPDFTQTPETLDCTDNATGTPCTMSYAPVETDLQTSTGVLLMGVTESNRGARSLFEVQQYFMEITVGQTQVGDGYSYCQQGETLCTGDVCSSTGHCLHWGGRGLAKVYHRSSVQSFDDWLVATGQLHADEEPSAD